MLTLKRTFFLSSALCVLSWAASAAEAQAATPTLVQHVASAMDQLPAPALILHLPNPALAGNALIIGVQMQQPGGTTVSVADDKSNTWIAGPSITNNSVTLSVFYALGVAGGTSKITVTFNGGNPINPQAVVSEFYNVATAQAADGSSTGASQSPVTAGSITTTGTGDLVYQLGVDVTNQGAYNAHQISGAVLTAGSGFTLLSADLEVGAVAQYQVQPTAGAITPAFAANPGTDTWASVAIALKSASAGTPPPSGMRIIHVYHWWGGTPTINLNPATIQFPSSGNLIVGSNASGRAAAANMSDSAGNTYNWSHTQGNPGDTHQVGQIIYAGNAATSPTLKITFGSWNPTGGSGHNMFVLYDVAGAASSPFDLASGTNGNTSNTSQTFGTITPTTANGLVFNTAPVYYQTVNSVSAPAILDSIVNPSDHNDAGGTPPSNLDEDNAFGHIYNGAAGTPVSFTYGSNGSSGYQFWSGLTLAFKAASGTPPPPPPPPPPSPCDVTGDGQVNVADVQKEVNMYLQVIPCINPSGTCTVASVQKVVNAALGGPCVTP